MSDAKVTIALEVNGEPAEVAFAPHKTLLEVLREDLNLTGTKHGCELGECGACAVLLDGQPVLSCLVLGVECEGREVLTVEGLVTDGRLHPLQETFADLGAADPELDATLVAHAVLGRLSDHLWQRTRPTRTEVQAITAFCLRSDERAS